MQLWKVIEQNRFHAYYFFSHVCYKNIKFVLSFSVSFDNSLVVDFSLPLFAVTFMFNTGM